MDENIKKKKVRTINGMSLWRILAYFIIYSVAGYIIETLYGIATKGVWESRQSFLYGPFLGIYGIGAVFILLFSKIIVFEFSFIIPAFCVAISSKVFPNI